MTIDIMMPFYGRPDHFRAAVESVLTQSDDRWRLTIIDDVYPDEEPGRWADSLNDPRVIYMRNDTNLRPSRNYNKAIGLVETPFTVIMGCDDIMLAGYIARAHELIERFPDSSVIQPGVEVIDQNGHSARPLADRVKAMYRFSARGAHSYRGEQLAASLLRGNWTYFPSLIWRTTMLEPGGFREDLDVVQDLAKLFEITAKGGSVVVDDTIVFQYRRHSASLSARTGTDGSKFRQERTFFLEAARASAALGWTRAARIARRHMSSRLHAATELPSAILHRNSTGRSTLTRHILGLSYAEIGQGRPGH